VGSTNWGYGIEPYATMGYGMAWVSRWKAAFIKPVAPQLMAIINRDIQAALDDVSGTPGVYAPFVEYDLAFLPVQQFPALLLAPERIEFDRDANDVIHAKAYVEVRVGVTHQDRNTLVQILEDYVRAVDEVLQSAFFLTGTDFASTTIPLPTPPFPAGSLSPGLPGGVPCDLFIESHGYEDMPRPAKSAFAMSAKLSVMVEMEES